MARVQYFSMKKAAVTFPIRFGCDVIFEFLSSRLSYYLWSNIFLSFSHSDAIEAPPMASQRWTDSWNLYSVFKSALASPTLCLLWSNAVTFYAFMPLHASIEIPYARLSLWPLYTLSNVKWWSITVRGFYFAARSYIPQRSTPIKPLNIYRSSYSSVRRP